MSGELKATIATIVVLLITMVIPGGRVLILPVIFALIIVLLFWLARPSDESAED